LYLFRAWVVYHNPNIITLSETWLNSKISDNEIQIETLHYIDLIEAHWVAVWLHTFLLT